MQAEHIDRLYIRQAVIDVIEAACGFDRQTKSPSSSLLPSSTCIESSPLASCCLGLDCVGKTEDRVAYFQRWYTAKDSPPRELEPRRQ
jgi:hypothetical protein